MTVPIFRMISIIFVNTNGSGEQADLAIPGIFQKFLGRPDRHALDQLILLDFHHLDRHVAGHQFNALQLGHFLHVGQAGNVGLLDFLFL